MQVDVGTIGYFHLLPRLERFIFLPLFLFAEHFVGL
jgi:hypothetical protein